MDGLINVADFSEGLDEDDSFKVGLYTRHVIHGCTACYRFAAGAGKCGGRDASRWVPGT